MKVLTTAGLTKLIQLCKSAFVDKTDVVETQTVTLATVATSGSYNDLSNKPSIPTVNNPTITFTQGGTTKGTITLNQSGGQTIEFDDDSVNAQKWAEGSDADVAALGGTHSAKGWANQEANNYSVTATGSTTPRTLKDRFADIINVKDFGAKGDGLTDDTTAFNAAGASGKAVFVPEGSYNLSSYIDHKNFIIGRNVSFPNKTVHYKQDSNTYKKSIVFSMPRVFDGYNTILASLSATTLWPQGFDYDKDGNCYIVMNGNNSTTAVIKLDNQYQYVGWIQLPYGSENPTIINKNNSIYLYIRSPGNTRKLTEYDITSAQWNGDNITGTDTALDYYNTQCDYEDGVWYVISAEALYGNGWNGRNWIKKYDENFNYLGYVKLPMQNIGGSNSNAYHYYMTKTQGFRVKDGKFYVSQGVGRNLSVQTTYNPCFDWGVSVISEDGNSLITSTMLNEEKFNTYLSSFGYTNITHSETEGLAKHPDGSIHHLYTTGTDILILREFDDSGIDFSDIASTYNFINLNDLQNTVYPVKLDTNGNEEYLDVVSGLQITQVSDFLEMMVNLDLQKLIINTSLLNVSGADGLTLPEKSMCVFNNANNSYIFCTITPNTGDGAETGIVFYKSGGSWVQNKRIKQLSYTFVLNSDGADSNRTYLKYSLENGYSYNAVVATDENLMLGGYNTTITGPKFISGYISDNNLGNTRRVWGSNYNAFFPGVSNTINLGNSTYLWKEIYCANATINTSDERQKQEIAPVDERVFKAWSKVEFKQFLFKDAVAEKGKEKARIHVGLIAQRVKEAFESEGLDGFKYGLLCYDEWDDEYEDIEVIDKEAEYDEEGNEISPAIKHTEKRLLTKAGNAYGIRYSEALALECAYQRWIIKKLEERTTNIENKME